MCGAHSLLVLIRVIENPRRAVLHYAENVPSLLSRVVSYSETIGLWGGFCCRFLRSPAAQCFRGLCERRNCSVLFLLLRLLFVLPIGSCYSSSSSYSQSGSADAEIKVPSVKKPELTNVLPFKPGVGQNIASYVSPTANNFFRVQTSAFPVHFVSFAFFIFSQFISLLLN